MEMRCYRRLLSISIKEHITNEEVRRRIENAIGQHVDLLNIVRQRKLKWYRHTTRSSGLAKTIMQGAVNGGRRRGRQKERWEDNIKECVVSNSYPPHLSRAPAPHSYADHNYLAPVATSDHRQIQLSHD
ncbi:eukaryotic translation initiation factor 3 subunit F [Elysia marginata]|uniref:Eukaryotic translation initiation factor 3 subunit F n=1 Tax=Elysia marginata TaxID=1093978 RepID=A0AAV4G6K9_9GAST|nr:eukaryotic translation initiation factor 3 subunit F [Elysia marginata]